MILLPGYFTFFWLLLGIIENIIYFYYFLFFCLPQTSVVIKVMDVFNLGAKLSLTIDTKAGLWTNVALIVFLKVQITLLLKCVSNPGLYGVSPFVNSFNFTDFCLAQSYAMIKHNKKRPRRGNHKKLNCSSLVTVLRSLWTGFLLLVLTCLLTYRVMRKSSPGITDPWTAIVGYNRYVKEDTKERSFSWPQYIVKSKILDDPHSVFIVFTSISVMKKPCSQPKQYLSREAIRDYFSYPCSASCLSIQLLSSSSCHVEPSIIQTK